jgi:hypothetical protein
VASYNVDLIKVIHRHLSAFARIMVDSRLLYCILIEVSLNEIAIEPLQLIYFSDVSVNMVSSEPTNLNKLMNF